MTGLLFAIVIVLMVGVIWVAVGLAYGPEKHQPKHRLGDVSPSTQSRCPVPQRGTPENG